MFWNYCRPFCRPMWFGPAAALMLLAPAASCPFAPRPRSRRRYRRPGPIAPNLRLRIPAVRTSTPGRLPKNPDKAPPRKLATQSGAAGQRSSPADQAQPAQPKSLTERRSKGQTGREIRQRYFQPRAVPAAQGAAANGGSLPRVAHKLAAGEPVVIVAFGSSSTQGYGTSSPEFTYPNRLAAQLHRKYPTADITVVNRGQRR